MSSAPESARREPALGLLRVLRDDGRTNPATDPFLAPESLLAMHREMCRARALDRALIALQRQGRVGYHSAAMGQEAVPVGTAFAVESSDWVFPALREGALLLARGFPLARYLAQAFGTAEDAQKGRQMPGHAGARSFNLVSSSSSVASQLPQAVGAAMAARKAGSRSITIGFVGDGGTSSPDFHAALNFAGVFRAPCVVICQNNQWAISTPTSRQTASETFAIKAVAYGVPGVRVDGNDILAVHRAVVDARVRAVAGGGPTLIECVTYRMSAHSTSDDPSRYEAPAEREAWAARDPIERFRRHLEYLGIVDQSTEASLAAQIDADISKAVTAAEAGARPDRSTLFDDVYANRPWHLAEQA